MNIWFKLLCCLIATVLLLLICSSWTSFSQDHTGHIKCDACFHIGQKKFLPLPKKATPSSFIANNQSYAWFQESVSQLFSLHAGHNSCFPTITVDITYRVLYFGSLNLCNLWSLHFSWFFKSCYHWECPLSFCDMTDQHLWEIWGHYHTNKIKQIKTYLKVKKKIICLCGGIVILIRTKIISQLTAWFSGTLVFQLFCTYQLCSSYLWNWERTVFFQC